MNAHLQRLAALSAVWAGLELLQRVAYRAGVTDAATAADATLTQLHDDLEPVDVSEVLQRHGDSKCVCCRTGAASWPA